MGEPERHMNSRTKKAQKKHALRASAIYWENMLQVAAGVRMKSHVKST